MATLGENIDLKVEIDCDLDDGASAIIRKDGIKKVTQILYAPHGASGDTGKACEVDRIETHVFLQTSEPDETAQEMLDISGKACFLHALCRTDLKTKLKIVRL